MPHHCTLEGLKEEDSSPYTLQNARGILIKNFFVNGNGGGGATVEHEQQIQNLSVSFKIKKKKKK